MLEIGKRLREVRTSKKRSIDSLSFETGISRSHIQRLECGEKKNPTVLTVWKLAESLEIEPAYLLSIK